MSEWGDMQSILQLGAGINLGVASVIAFFGDRFAREETYLENARRAMGSLKSAATSARINDSELSLKISEAEAKEKVVSSSLEAQKQSFKLFKKWVQYTILLLSFICLALLLVSSYYSKENIALGGKFIDPGLVFVLASAIVLVLPTFLLAINTSALEGWFLGAVEKQRIQLLTLHHTCFNRFNDLSNQG
jgi:hypothetical protein